VLGKSDPLRPEVNGWREIAIDFKTLEETQAIVISVERQNCHADPCPAFGTLWLDSFSLENR
jgi:hypothetical protein